MPLKFWGCLLHGVIAARAHWDMWFSPCIHITAQVSKHCHRFHFIEEETVLGRLNNFPKSGEWHSWVSNSDLPLKPMLKATTLCHLPEALLSRGLRTATAETLFQGFYQILSHSESRWNLRAREQRTPSGHSDIALKTFLSTKWHRNTGVMFQMVKI